MFIQKRIDNKYLKDQQAYLEKAFEERGIVLAKNSFENGCIKEGVFNCENQNPGIDTFNSWMRNNCYQSTVDSCKDKAENFAEWLAQKGLNP